MTTKTSKNRSVEIYFTFPLINKGILNLASVVFLLSIINIDVRTHICEKCKKKIN